MSNSRRNILILVALLAVWAAAFLLRPAGPSGRPAPPDARRLPPAPAPPHLRTELLETPRAGLPAEMHNIFGSPPPPPAPAGGGAPGAPGGAAAPAQPPPPPPDPFIEGAKQLRYVGFLKSGDGTFAFIVRGQEVHTLGVGGVLQGRYRVQTVTENDVLLASPEGDKQVRLLIVPAGTQSPPQAPARPVFQVPTEAGQQVEPAIAPQSRLPAQMPHRPLPQPPQTQ